MNVIVAAKDVIILFVIVTVTVNKFIQTGDVAMPIFMIIVVLVHYHCVIYWLKMQAGKACWQKNDHWFYNMRAKKLYMCVANLCKS